MATVIEMRGHRPSRPSGHIARLDEDQVLEVVRLAAQLGTMSLTTPAEQRVDWFRGIVDTLLDGIPNSRLSPTLQAAFVRAATEGGA